jgi:uncharacterized protein (UPF0261 family)
MNRYGAIAIVGAFDTTGEQHYFLKERIERKGNKVLTINIGTDSSSSFLTDFDLYEEIAIGGKAEMKSADDVHEAVLKRAQGLILDLYKEGKISGIISAGDAKGTRIGTNIMRVLPIGFPKLMVSTVASWDMSQLVGTKDIMMMHCIADMSGLNTVLGDILDKAAGAICGMLEDQWEPKWKRKCVALTLFGLVTEAAEWIKESLENLGYEVIAFHANGTGGMAMEELAAEGYFHGILDLATHELADELKQGYCSGIGPQRLEPVPGKNIPRLVMPGGLDCAVLEFTKESIPQQYKHRKIFFYDFRSAIRLDVDETKLIAKQLAEKLNKRPANIQILIPMGGWSEADRKDGPLYDTKIRDAFVQDFKKNLDPTIEIREVELHINDPSFAEIASEMMHQMIEKV